LSSDTRCLVNGIPLGHAIGDDTEAGLFDDLDGLSQKFAANIGHANVGSVIRDTLHRVSVELPFG
jgi:hypothetical protein